MIRQAARWRRVHRQQEFGPVVEALCASSARCTCPSFDETRRAIPRAAGRSTGGHRGRQLQVVAGVGLVDAGVADRGEVVLAHAVGIVAHGWRDDVDARRMLSNLGGSK